MSTENRLRGFFSFYGGKWAAAKKYPVPKYKRLIEPFAGSAGYSLHYPHLDVTLYELDHAIFGVWDFLLKSSKSDILNLPIHVNHVNDLNVCQEAKWLIGFWLNKGTATPHLSPSAWMREKSRPHSFWGETIRHRIASQIDSIRHWNVINKSYEEADDVEATWFIDPPYQDKGKRYRCRIKDYQKLGQWCKTRRGQVMVCEQEGADWLPFRYFATILSTKGKKRDGHSQEVIWENDDIIEDGIS